MNEDHPSPDGTRKLLRMAQENDSSTYTCSAKKHSWHIVPDGPKENGAHAEPSTPNNQTAQIYTTYIQMIEQIMLQHCVLNITTVQILQSTAKQYGNFHISWSTTPLCNWYRLLGWYSCQQDFWRQNTPTWQWFILIGRHTLSAVHIHTSLSSMPMCRELIKIWFMLISQLRTILKNKKTQAGPSQQTRE